jgi:hypothetical protein
METIEEKSDCIYHIICINKDVGEYGVEKIGTHFIVARGEKSHCEQILALIDPKIEKEIKEEIKLNIFIRFYNYIKSFLY